MSYTKCPTCDGTGKVKELVGFQRIEEADCRHCKATGCLPVATQKKSRKTWGPQERKRAVA